MTPPPTDSGPSPTDTFRTIAAPTQGLYKEKGSKFLAFAFPATTETEVKSLLEQKRKEFFDARHHCYAYILGARGTLYRANDDGEPSGTAGKPIHGQLLSFDLTNVLLIVVRYFGGIKLGTSGLINAYRTAARDALQQAQVVERLITARFVAHFDYADMNDVMRQLKLLGLQPGAQRFEEQCQLQFDARLSAVSSVEKAFEPLHRIRLVRTDADGSQTE